MRRPVKQQQHILNKPTSTISQHFVPFLQVVRDHTAVAAVKVLKRRVHSDYGKTFNFRVPNNIERTTYCKALNPHIWIECAARHESSQTRIKSKLYCTRESHVVSIPNAHVELWGFAHEAVPGAVFDSAHSYTPQIFARPPKQNYVAHVVAEFDELGVAIFPYLSAQGHFVHETLPRVVWLLQTLRTHIPILVPMDEHARKY